MFDHFYLGHLYPDKSTAIKVIFAAVPFTRYQPGSQNTEKNSRAVAKNSQTKAPTSFVPFLLIIVIIKCNCDQGRELIHGPLPQP